MKKLVVNDISMDPDPFAAECHWGGIKGHAIVLFKMALAIGIFGSITADLNSKNQSFNGEPLPDCNFKVTWGFTSFFKNWELAFKVLCISIFVACGRKSSRIITASDVTGF